MLCVRSVGAAGSSSPAPPRSLSPTLYRAPVLGTHFSAQGRRNNQGNQGVSGTAELGSSFPSPAAIAAFCQFGLATCYPRRRDYYRELRERGYGTGRETSWRQAASFGSASSGRVRGADLPRSLISPRCRPSRDVEITAVCTTRQESAEAAARHFGIPLAFSDPARLAQHPDIDLVTVCVKVPDHYPPVMAAIDAGKHVYCEWPLGRNTDEAARMLMRRRRRRPPRGRTPGPGVAGDQLRQRPDRARA